jgi:hypothetical protein
MNEKFSKRLSTLLLSKFICLIKNHWFDPGAAFRMHDIKKFCPNIDEILNIVTLSLTLFYLILDGQMLAKIKW